MIRRILIQQVISIKGYYLLIYYLGSITAESLKKANSPYVTRKRALYENCRLLAPDNELLSLIDTRKANWYFERDLAG